MLLAPELRPGPRCGSLHAPPDPLAGFGEGNREGGWKWLERERKRRGEKGRRGKGRMGREMEIRGEFVSIIGFRGYDAPALG